MMRYLPVIIILILSLSLRLFLLDEIPTGISDDELDYIFNAKAFFLTGSDISGTWNPFSLKPPPLEYPKAELPYIFISPLIGIFPFSLFSARLPYALINTMFVLVLYLTSKKLFGRSSSIAIGLLAAINPWMIYFGRTAFDTPISSFLYFSSLLVLLYAKKYVLLAVIPLLFFAFYSYIGSKLIFIPFSLIIIYFSWKYINRKKYTKIYIFILLVLLGTVINYLYSLGFQSNQSRTNEILTPFHYSIQEKVDKERKLSINTPLRDLLSNKISTYMKHSVGKYYETFSPQLLFLYGEGRSTFSVWNHGLYYYIDALFLFIGLYSLYKYRRQIFLLLLAIILIAPLPTVLSNVGTSYALRSFLLFPTLLIIMGYGISSLVNLFRGKLKLIVILSIIALYSLSLLNFLNIYILQNPIYNSEGFGFSGRILSKYIKLASIDKQGVILIEKNSKNSIPPLFKQYLFYNKLLDKETVNEISSIVKRGNYEYKNFKISDCPEESIPLEHVVIAYSGTKCESVNILSKNLSISQLSDGGEIYKIFNDNVCKKYKLKNYPTNIKLEDLQVESLSEKTFCEQFITRFN